MLIINIWLLHVVGSLSLSLHNHLIICFDEIWGLETGKMTKIAFIWEITPHSTIVGRPSSIPRGNRYLRNVHTPLPNFTALRSNLTCCQCDRYHVRDLNCVRPEFKLGAVLLTWMENWWLSGSMCLRSRLWVWSCKTAPLTGCLGFSWDLKTSVFIRPSFILGLHYYTILSKSSKSTIHGLCIWRDVDNITN